jgi:hypothetical protein
MRCNLVVALVLLGGTGCPSGGEVAGVREDDGGGVGKGTNVAAIEDRVGNRTGDSGAVDALPRDGGNVAGSQHPLRWAPGHYVQFGLNDSLSSVQSIIANLPASVVGVVRPRYWGRIETSKGTYDWSDTQAVIDTATSYGKSVIFECASRGFGGSDPSSFVPQYLVNEGLTYSRTTPSAAAGAALWRAQAMAYKVTLEKAFIDQFGARSNVVMISGDESIFGQGLPGDYSIGAYLSEETGRQNTLRAYAPQIGVTVYSNWLNGDDSTATHMQSLFQNVVTTNGIFLNGGPDASYANGYASDGYEVLDGRKGPTNYVGGKYAVLCGVQAAETSGTTLAQVFSEFDSHFEAPYQQWYVNGWGTYNWTSLRSFLANNPVTHTAYPTLGP